MSNVKTTIMCKCKKKDLKPKSAKKRSKLERQKMIRRLTYSMSAVILFTISLLSGGAIYFGNEGNLPMAHVLKDMLTVAIPALSGIVVAALAVRNS